MENETLDLNGNWVQEGKKGSDSYQAGYIRDGEMELFWITEDGNRAFLYWAGSYEALTDLSRKSTWNSVNNKDKTESVLIASKKEKNMIEIGIKAPAFTLPDQNGEMKSLADYHGQKVILYFYSKDMTSGCTKQACAFTDLYPQFLEKGAVVIGVSKDSVASHKRFEEKYGLPFPLLSDPEMEVLQAYDVLKEKKTKGKTSMSVVRTTYLIDEDGMIVKGFEKVKADDNPAQMLGELE